MEKPPQDCPATAMMVVMMVVMVFLFLLLLLLLIPGAVSHSCKGE